MNFSIRNVQLGSRRDGIGHSEAIPRWSVTSRAALGVLAVLALLVPIALVAALVLMTEVDSRVLVAGFGMLVFHGILVLLFISFVGQNPAHRRAAPAVDRRLAARSADHAPALLVEAHLERAVRR